MNYQKITVTLCALSAVVFSAVAQKNVPQANISQVSFHREEHRQEIVIPKIGQYNVYTADLHTHTIYSDGDVTPKYRVREAWRDGLDIIAITDHIEYRSTERELYRFMSGYIKDEYRGLEKAVNTNIAKTAPDERGILVDLNVGYEAAKAVGEKFGVMVIRGAEITRGDNHFNAIFTKDNNKIYDVDTEQSLRNAIAQGALIIHNHPKRDKSTMSQMTPLAEDFYAKGLINGIELGNSLWIWGHLFSYCLDSGYTPISGTDVHGTIAEKYYQSGNESTYRNMTLILAKRCDENSIKSAIKEGRTIAYQNNKLIGKEEYLSGLFKASVKVEKVANIGNSTAVVVTNTSSFPYEVKYGKKTAVIHAMGAVQLSLPKGANNVTFTVTTLICGSKRYPKIDMTLEKR